MDCLWRKPPISYFLSLEQRKRCDSFRSEHFGTGMEGEQHYIIQEEWIARDKIHYPFNIILAEGSHSTASCPGWYHRSAQERQQEQVEYGLKIFWRTLPVLSQKEFFSIQNHRLKRGLSNSPPKITNSFISCFPFSFHSLQSKMSSPL